MRFLWEQSWKVLDGTVELAEMYSKAISWLPTQECEPLMWEALLLVGAVSLHKPMIALCAAPRKEKPAPLSVRDSHWPCTERGKAAMSRKSGACSWAQDMPGCLTLPILLS